MVLTAVEKEPRVGMMEPPAMSRSSPLATCDRSQEGEEGVAVAQPDTASGAVEGSSDLELKTPATHPRDTDSGPLQEPRAGYKAPTICTARLHTLAGLEERTGEPPTS